MSIQFLYEDGKGTVVDEEGQPQPMEAVIDDEQQELSPSPEASVTTSGSGQANGDDADDDDDTNTDGNKGSRTKRRYTLYENQDKVKFFKLIFEKSLSASAAAKQLGVHVRTAQRWANQYEKDRDKVFKKRRKTGRPRLLNDEHRKAIVEFVENHPSVSLDQVLDQLKQSFPDLKVSKSTVYDFIRNRCNLSLKRARIQPADKDNEEKLRERLEW
ncbi:uncharacterized protein BYT42DRAFT_485301, partial [Radiomyces spectabilis]|uniref:uncharacterized protein n=1 Tax=Radiomyces spectabilis TaxID=64574 RepID=UPI00221E85BA